MAVSLSQLGGPRVETEEFGVTGPFDRPKINFIQGGATSISVVDNPGLDKVDVTITSTDTGNTNTYETGNCFAGNIPSAAGGYNVNGSWPGTGFTPHGILLVTASTTDDFINIGFAKANLSGVGNQAFVGVSTGFIGNAGASLSAAAGSTISSQTPLSNSWNVSRTGASGAAWNYASIVFGRANS